MVAEARGLPTVRAAFRPPLPSFDAVPFLLLVFLVRVRAVHALLR
jgi:hypothetical protein